MATLYNDIGDPQRALALYENALTIFHQIDDRGGEASVLHGMANVFGDTGDPTRALDLFEQALVTRCQINDRSGEAATLSDTAGLYRTTGQPARALELYEQSLLIQRVVGSYAGEAHTLAGMGILAHNANRPAAGFKLVLLGATLLAERGIVAPSWLSEALATQTQQLGYEEAQMAALRAEVMAIYTNDRGDNLIHEAFPEGTTLEAP